MRRRVARVAFVSDRRSGRSNPIRSSAVTAPPTGDDGGPGGVGPALCIAVPLAVTTWPDRPTVRGRFPVTVVQRRVRHRCQRSGTCPCGRLRPPHRHGRPRPDRTRPLVYRVDSRFKRQYTVGRAGPTRSQPRGPAKPAGEAAWSRDRTRPGHSRRSCRAVPDRVAPLASDCSKARLEASASCMGQGLVGDTPSESDRRGSGSDRAGGRSSRHTGRFTRRKNSGIVGATVEERRFAGRASDTKVTEDPFTGDSFTATPSARPPPLSGRTVPSRPVPVRSEGPVA